MMVTDEVPLPDTEATPLEPAVTLSVPSPTDKVAVSTPAPPSMSATPRPVFFRFTGCCSVAE